MTSVLNRTSALLPNALFASLGVPRTDESIGDAKLGIDQELKRACEDAISLCADSVARPLRDWAARVRVYTNPSTSSDTKAPIAQANPAAALSSQEWASLQAAESLDDTFRASCERDLRSAAARVALYLEEPRTVSVILAHVRERVAGDYVGFADAARGVYGLRVGGKLMNTQECAAVLRRACEVEGVV